MRFLIISLLFLPLFRGAAPTARGVCPDGPPTIFKTRRRNVVPFEHPSVVFIRAECSACSGFVVRPGIVATASHCTRFLGEHQDVFVNGKPHVFQVISRWKGNPDFTIHDVALLKGNTEDLVPFDLAENDNEEGPCGSLGWGGLEGPKGPYEKVALCRLSGQKTPDGMLVIMGDIDHGDSGGPVVDSEGKVVGINEAISEFDIPVFWATPVSSLKNALKKLGL